MNKVTVHHCGDGQCVQCYQTQHLMDTLKIEYESVDLKKNPKIAKEFAAQGHGATPIVTAGGTVWCGFKYENIKALARHHHV